MDGTRDDDFEQFEPEEIRTPDEEKDTTGENFRKLLKVRFSRLKLSLSANGGERQYHAH